MTTPKRTLWEVEPHTKAKHEILRRYLEAWFPILGSIHGRIIYIDGFSGPGRYTGGERGSPLIAINVAKAHETRLKGKLFFLFIDEREDRIDNLNQELNSITIPPNFKVTTKCGRFHEILDQILGSVTQLAPTFAFIDPFGFSGIPFVTIKKLLEQRRCEAFITFMADAINRFLEQENVVQHIVETFGTEDAVQIAREPDRVTRLRNLYQNQLNTIAKYVRYFEMRDPNNRVIYYLFFATNNELGHLKMKESMWRLDPTGEFRFSDKTDPNQLILLEADPIPNLIQLLRSQFLNKGSVTGEEIRRYVENETPYLKKHMTEALKLEETAGKVNCKPIQIDGKKRKARTYPDGIIITFI